jgi:glycosyltransferase involved in cell wall biosynthesis
MGAPTITVVKVAYDIGPLKPRPAGVGVYVRSLAIALAERPDTELAFFGRRPDIIGLPDVSISRIRPAWMPYSMWAELLAPLALRGLDGDIVHFTDGLVPLIRRQPTVVTVLDLSLVRQWRSHRAVRYLRIPLVLASPRLATRVLVPSDATADELMKLTGTTGRRIDVVPLAPASKERVRTRQTAHSALAHHDLSPHGYLLMLGTIEPRKNHLRVLLAFQKLAAAGEISGDIDLVIAGQQGWRADSILEAIRESPIKHRVKVLGYVPDEEIPPLLAEAAAVVYPSTYEGFGLPVIEAMAEGAAVVTSNVSSMPEAAGDAAVLVDPYDVSSIAKGIQEAVASAASMRDRARSHAASFTWAKTAEGTVESYRRAAK